MAEMTLDRFLDLLDRHGPVIDRWPEAHRDGAETLHAPADGRAVYGSVRFTF